VTPPDPAYEPGLAHLDTARDAQVRVLFGGDNDSRRASLSVVTNVAERDKNDMTSG